jgi:hypothetical protein
MHKLLMQTISRSLVTARRVRSRSDALQTLHSTHAWPVDHLGQQTLLASRVGL